MARDGLPPLAVLFHTYIRPAIGPDRTTSSAFDSTDLLYDWDGVVRNRAEYGILDRREVYRRHWGRGHSECRGDHLDGLGGSASAWTVSGERLPDP